MGKVRRELVVTCIAALQTSGAWSSELQGQWKDACDQ